jgi:phage I-like protein
MTETALMPPEPQRLRALEHANAVRLARAELKRQIAEGETSAAAVILECPEAVRRWTVSELLMSQRRWGSTRCRKFLERNGVSEIKAIGSLTDRQRHLLAEQLTGCTEVVDNLAAGRAAELAAARELVLA